ncbi:competence type IV pilus minor pilin ComGD [Rossellomorea oryzaecorticis]|uniref:Competence type IV pilus minor pilin ComGD n=1 Tax=Rossellomorea oryzaecorticis TaxID=1396505 RepID=A0ABU9KD70_9BACI
MQEIKRGLLAQKGFTFIEMLMVLLIFSVLLSFAAFSSEPMKEHAEKTFFISQLHSDLYLIQSQSFFTQNSITLVFYPSSNKYVAKDFYGMTLVSRELPPGIQISEINRWNEIIFNPTGNTNRFGPVYFNSEDSTIKLSFQIGQGRFYVQEF